MDTILMPKALTADNGAKYLMIGEFVECTEISCYECDSEGEVQDGCEECGGTGTVLLEIPVEWTTIKAIYKLAVEHFGAVPSDPETSPDPKNTEITS